jgi:hypothetical protein
MSLIERIKLSFINKNAPLSRCRKCSLFHNYLKGINFPSKHNVAPLVLAIAPKCALSTTQTNNGF